MPDIDIAAIRARAARAGAMEVDEDRWTDPPILLGYVRALEASADDVPALLDLLAERDAEVERLRLIVAARDLALAAFSAQYDETKAERDAAIRENVRLARLLVQRDHEQAALSARLDAVRAVLDDADDGDVVTQADGPHVPTHLVRAALTTTPETTTTEGETP